MGPGPPGRVFDTDNRNREPLFRLSLPPTIVVVTTFSGPSASLAAFSRKPAGAVFRLESGFRFFRVPAGLLDVDRFRGSAGECMKVSVVGVNSAAGGGGGGGGGGDGTERGGGGVAATEDGGRVVGALVMSLLGSEGGCSLHRSFHLFNAFLKPVPWVVVLIVSVFTLIPEINPPPSFQL